EVYLLVAVLRAGVKVEAYRRQLGMPLGEVGHHLLVEDAPRRRGIGELALGEVGLDQRVDDARVAALVEERQDLGVAKRAAEKLDELGARNFAALAVVADDLHLVDSGLEEEVLHRLLVLQVLLALAALHLVERRLRDVEVPVLEELGVLPEEEREKERADVRTVDVRIGHDDDPVVAEPIEVLVLVDAAARPRA